MGRAFNPLLLTDVYKMSHGEQYCPGTTKVYSHLVARSNKVFDRTVFFGLQYYLDNYLTVPLEPWMAEEFLSYRGRILGPDSASIISRNVRALCDLGYWPVKIKAVPEGTVMPVRNVLMTIESTHEEFYWCVGFVESLILKLWYPITVASCCYRYRRLVDRFFDRTVDPDMDFLRQFTVHDFGYRGDSSEEGAAISGAAHLLSFHGSDTVPALPFIDRFYSTSEGSMSSGAHVDGKYMVPQSIMASVPASEHSVMCSFGREDELEAFRHMLRTYPAGIVSIVSDTYNVYDVLTRFVMDLKESILARDGKVVFRPDSGNPEYIICGDPSAPAGSPEQKGALRLLEEAFGSALNDKGYRVLNPKVGLLYGDGMYYERYERTLERMADMGFAASNLVIGVGGILRNHSRDTLGFAMKATYVEVNGEQREIEKDPVTDHGKKSLKGLLRLDYDGYGQYVTHDRQTPAGAEEGLLETVFVDGAVRQRTDLFMIRSLVEQGLTRKDSVTSYLNP